MDSNYNDLRGMNLPMEDSIQGEFCEVLLDGKRPGKCSKTGSQFVDVKVPVVLKSKPIVGRIEVECCGEPTLQCMGEECNTECEVLITQKICVKIPVQYDVSATMGESCIACDAASCCN